MAKAKPQDPELSKTLMQVAGAFGAQGQGLTGEIDGTPMGTVWRGDRFSNKPLMSGSEFMLREVKVGKSGKILFVFDPVDAQDFEWLEIPANKIDTMMPVFTPQLARKFSIDTEDMEELIGKVGTQIALEASLAAEKAAAEVKKGVENHPLFGAFG